jgi:acyl-CoA synthetase (AMP-forming)/AMP-acid ligase II
VLGQAIVLVVTPRGVNGLDADQRIAECRRRLPGYMVPALIKAREGSLPRNPNGKIDRKLLASELAGLFDEKSPARD